MIIFGARGVTTTPERGEFNCPSCRSKQQYGLKRVRRFFTLYFIPVIPLDKQGEYVECLNCNDTFKPNILDYDPVKNSVAIEAEYHSAIKKVMIHVLLSDGVIDEDEVVTAQDIYQRIAGQKIEKSQLHKEIEQIEASNESLSSTLINLQGSLNDEGKEMVVKAALYVAMADGEFQKEEQAMLVQIGKDLGMTQAHLKGVLSSADS